MSVVSGLAAKSVMRSALSPESGSVSAAYSATSGMPSPSASPEMVKVTRLPACSRSHASVMPSASVSAPAGIAVVATK